MPTSGYQNPALAKCLRFRSQNIWIAVVPVLCGPTCSKSGGLRSDKGGSGRRGTSLTKVRMILESRLMSLDLRELAEQGTRLEPNSVAQRAPLFPWISEAVRFAVRLCPDRADPAATHDFQGSPVCPSSHLEPYHAAAARVIRSRWLRMMSAGYAVWFVSQS